MDQGKLEAVIEVGTQPRVLVVQPNRNYVSVLARHIGEVGYRVSTADGAGPGRRSPKCTACSPISSSPN